MPDIDTSQLEAVNTMLSLIGEAPVNSLTTNVTADVALATRTLDEVSRGLQVEGWFWNKDHKITITADGNKKFAWQSDWIEFDTIPGRYSGIDIGRRGQFLYDHKNGTDVFSEATLEGTVVRYLGWDDLPEAARNYIMIRAARIFLNRTLGDEVRAGYAMEDERRARHTLDDAENRQGDYNFFSTGPPAEISRITDIIVP